MNGPGSIPSYGISGGPCANIIGTVTPSDSLLVSVFDQTTIRFRLLSRLRPRLIKTGGAMVLAGFALTRAGQTILRKVNP